MRFFCIALLVTCIFATNQVAMALDACCMTAESTDHTGNDVNTSAEDSHHCPMGAHHTMSLLPRDNGLDIHLPTASRGVWPDIAARDSFIGEGPVEPPAFA